jgi:hypothetical protein
VVAISLTGVATRILLQVTIPHEPFNSFVRDGTVGAKMEQIMKQIKPEAIYFTEQDGHRGAVAVVDISDASQIPAMAEPWFLSFNADVKMCIAMTPADLAKSGIDKLGKKW